MEKKVSDEEKEHLKNCLEAAKRYRLKHFVRPGKADDDDSFLCHDRKAYDNLKIICYGSDSFDTHDAYNVDLDNHVLHCKKSHVFSKGDGTVVRKAWKHVFGGLNKEIVYAEESSNHVSMVNDKKLRIILLNSCFDNDKKA